MATVGIHEWDPGEYDKGLSRQKCKACWETRDSDIHQTDQGIYPKYVVFKHPKEEASFFLGQYMAPGATSLRHLEDVDDFCFVLKPIKDKHARVAMAAYAESVKEEKPKLAKDLYEILGDY